MSHSPLFRKLAQTISTAYFCEKHRISTAEGIEAISTLEFRMSKRRIKRREFFTDMGKFALLGGTIGVASSNFHRVLAAPSTVDASIAIVGAGLAGLSCGYSLHSSGIQAIRGKNKNIESFSFGA